MTQEDTTNIVRSYSRARKQRLLDGTRPFVVVVREGRVIATLSGVELNSLLQLTDTAASGYGADALAVVVEGVFPMVEVNPVTGQNWKRGESEELWLEHDGVAKGWVSEVAFTTVASREGWKHVEAFPFHSEDGTIVWRDTTMTISVGGLDDALLDRLSRPVADPTRVPDPGDGFAGDAENGPFYDAQFGRVALDIGITRVLGNQLPDGEVEMVVESDDRAEYLISEGLPSWQVEVWAPQAEGAVDV